MADKLFTLEIVTPRKVVYSGEVRSFSAPGVMGGFQVLFNHAPLLSAVSVGKIKLEDKDGTVTELATSGGFVEVKDNKVVMLAESAELPAEIDVPRAQSAKERAMNRLAEHRADTDVDRARASYDRAVNRLKIARN